MEQRANIKCYFKLGKTAAKTLELMRQVYGDDCLSRVQIFRWHARFKSGVETTEDEARSGHPFSVRNEGLIAKVRKRIQEESCVTVRMMADEFGVSVFWKAYGRGFACPARVLSTRQLVSSS